MDISVSIVNWNTRDELRDCLESVLKQNNGIEFEVFVVDNASSDGSADMVRNEFGGRIKVIANDKNIGFGAAHNIATREMNGKYAMLLNPDCRMIEPDVLSKLFRFMEENPNAGICGPKIINPDGSLQYSARRFPTMFAAAFRHTLFGKLFPKNRFVRDYMMTDWSHNELREVDWLSGSALFMRKKMLDEIGLMDERFFMYLEDVDMCKRAHDAGWGVVYYPLVSVCHRIGASSDQNPIPMIKQHHRSMMLYYIKHHAAGPRILLVPIAAIALRLRMRSLIKRARR